jgi:LuxR family transcriptional regulator, maltose regulon positive regulatory protein
MIDSSDYGDDGIPLLDTKLHIPAPRPVVVPRPRLVERLRRGVEGRLTLLSAPPGFGKTNLLAEWLASPGVRPAAGWLSLDAGDNDPTVFWAYLLAALRPVCPDAVGQPLSLLLGRRQYPVETVLTALINAIGSDGEEAVLVLDDYHLIQTPSIHDGIAFLLDHLPRRAHLVIASRTDPPLPLARLRARGQLTELRTADLRFTPEEATALLGPGTSPGLTAKDVAVLASRTEGWVAGLQLAALSIEGRQDAHGFVEAFSGVTRHIADYLVEEVLQRQPEGVRDFLLRTSILERMTGPLCDAVTGGEDGHRLLEELERRNLFVVPLDDRREWYRYHHLFAEVLRRHLAEAPQERVRALHRRASAWHRRHGSPADAVRHALAAGDTESAADLLERAWPAMDRAYQSATWLGWVRALPDARVRASAALSAGYAWALLYEGELAAAEARLRDAERTVAVAESAEPECEWLRALPTSIATARAYLAQAGGDVPGTIEHARRSLDLMAEEDHLARGPAAALLGLAYWTAGDLEAARRNFGAGMDSLRAAGDFVSAIGGSFVLGEILVAQGRLGDAARTYEHALQLAAEHTPPDFPGVGDLYLGLADQRRERGDLAGAAALLESARAAYERVGHLGSEQRWHVAAARLRVSEGNPGAALGLLDEAERARVPTPLPDLRPATALRARIWTGLGRLDEAAGWARARELSAGDEPEYLREYEHLTLACLLIALPATAGHAAPANEALALLDRLEHAAEAGGRSGSLIEILILRALANQAHGGTARALGDLERALSLAEPEGYCRTFVDEGEPMRRLLRRAAASGIGGAYTRALLDAFESPRNMAAAPTPPAETLAPPLTDRELQILRLIAAGMRSREIADQLSIRPATVKRHIANTYEKLGVGHRTAAVARAIQLQLL